MSFELRVNQPFRLATHSSRPKLSATAVLPSYLVLLRVGFALPAALLSQRCALTAPFHPYPGVAAEAVCFLWHFPSIRLESDVPDVIRHTALRSSDFPLLAPEDAGSDRPVRLPTEIIIFDANRVIGFRLSAPGSRKLVPSFSIQARFWLLNLIVHIPLPGSRKPSP